MLKHLLRTTLIIGTLASAFACSGAITDAGPDVKFRPGIASASVGPNRVVSIEATHGKFSLRGDTLFGAAGNSVKVLSPALANAIRLGTRPDTAYAKFLAIPGVSRAMKAAQERREGLTQQQRRAADSIVADAKARARAKGVLREQSAAIWSNRKGALEASDMARTGVFSFTPYTTMLDDPCIAIGSALYDIGTAIVDAQYQFNATMDAFTYYVNVQSPYAFEAGEELIAIAGALDNLYQAREIVANLFVDMNCFG